MVKGLNMGGIRPINKKAILSHLNVYGASSRKQIAASIKLTTAAVTVLTTELIEEGLIYEVGAVSEGKVGRKQVMIDLVPDSNYSLGLEITRAGVYFSIINLKAELIFNHSWTLGRLITEQDLAEILEFVEHKISDIRSKILGMGIFAPGYVYENMEWSMGVRNLKEIVQKKLDIAVILENNMRGLALSETFKNKEKNNFWLVKYGPGVGSSIVLNGNVVAGQGRMAGEVGHVVFSSSEDACDICGQKGCLESQIRFENLISKLDKKITSSYERKCDESDFQYLYRVSEKSDFSLLQEAVKKFSEVLVIGHSLLDSGKIILAGEIFSNKKVYDWLLKNIKEKNSILKPEMISCMEDYNEKTKKAPGILILREYFNGDLFNRI